MSRLALLMVLTTAVASAQNPPPRSDSPAPSPKSKQKQQAPPRSEQESSSKDSVTDLSPPPGESDSSPDAYEDMAASGTNEVQEMKPYNPHRAAKDIEVGDYYFGRGNYRAAVLRYRDALDYKPKDPESTFKLARTLEKLDELKEAASLYKQYGKIAPGGPFADAAAKGLDRLRDHAPKDDPDSLMAEAEKLMSAREFGDASERLRAVLAKEPENSTAKFRLAQSLEALGQVYDAMQYYYEYLHDAAGGPHAEAASRAMERLKKQGVTLTSPSAQTPR